MYKDVGWVGVYEGARKCRSEVEGGGGVVFL